MATNVFASSPLYVPSLDAACLKLKMPMTLLKTMNILLLRRYHHQRGWREQQYGETSSVVKARNTPASGNTSLQFRGPCWQRARARAAQRRHSADIRRSLRLHGGWFGVLGVDMAVEQRG